MRSSERYVFDANVIVSALLFPDSKPGRAFFLALRRSSVLISDMLMSELRNVLYRPKFDRYVSPEDQVRLLDLLMTRLPWCRSR
jgi:predicted nucleic acid-binding protein